MLFDNEWSIDFDVSHGEDAKIFDMYPLLRITSLTFELQYSKRINSGKDVNKLVDFDKLQM